MRDLLVLAFGIVAIILTFRSPFIGVLTYYCFSVMAPHRYTWGFAYDLQFVQIAAIATMISAIIHYKQLSFPKLKEVYLFFVFWIFITLTTFTALYPENARVEWFDVCKIFIMVLLTMLIVNTRKKLIYFILSIIVFVGFLSVKGAVFSILTGGKWLLWGPAQSYLADNNFVGVAMIMLIPLCFFLKDSFRYKWINYSILIIGLCSIISAIFTYSRGAFVGLVGMGLFLLIHSRHKAIVFSIITIMIITAFMFLPTKWIERMSSISTYEFDSSARQRLDAWAFSYRMANAHLLGGGFECFTPQQYKIYSSNPELNIRTFQDGTEYAHTAHSIYFEVLAEHGYMGLMLYLACLTSILYTLYKIRKQASSIAGFKWVSSFSNAFNVSIIGYMISAAFVSRAFFELFWVIFAAAVCFICVAEREMLKRQTQEHSARKIKRESVPETVST